MSIRRLPEDANHTFLHERASNKRYNLWDSLYMHEKFLSSSPSWG